MLINPTEISEKFILSYKFWILTAVIELSVFSLLVAPCRIEVDFFRLDPEDGGGMFH
jgi:hypothetical protein